MSVFSVTCFHSSFCLSAPFHSSAKVCNLTTLIPLPTLKSSLFPPRFSRDGNWDSRGKIFCANSADPERDNLFPTQFSHENVAASEDNGSNPSTSVLSVLCPLLKLFSARDPSQERNYILEVATSTLSTLARLPWGSRSRSDSLYSKDTSIEDPPMCLQLFEFEACPFCRRVREALTELDLSVEIYPCPKGSVRHREMVRRFGGKEQFPFLVDPNTGISMYESSEIVKYLFRQYGKGRNPSIGLLESFGLNSMLKGTCLDKNNLKHRITGVLKNLENFFNLLIGTLFTGWMPTILRAGRGMTLWEKPRVDPPLNKLELFSYENNPYARIVREALCELELPYILQNVGIGSPRTRLLLETSGSKEVPYIIDPNTGTQIGDYKKILSYLFQTYSKVTF